MDIQGGVSPSGISRPKHKRTFTGFGATEIKSVEGTQVYLCSIEHADSLRALDHDGSFLDGEWGFGELTPICNLDREASSLTDRQPHSFDPRTPARSLDQTSSQWL